MPRTCSHCLAEIADDSSHCAQCGQPQDGATRPVLKTEDSQRESSQGEGDRRFPIWQILPWTLLAAALLLMLPLLRHSHSQSASAMQAPAVQSAAIPLPVVAPLTSQAAGSPASSGTGAMKIARPTLPIAASSSAARVPVSAVVVPLTVSLYSASRSKHVPVGTPVTISAYAALPPGQSATLAVSYGKDSGPRSLLALTQGSLSSTTWIPFLPGRYLFTASALDSRRSSAFSHPLTIWADAPVLAPVAKPAVPVRIAAEPAAPKLRPAAVTAAARSTAGAGMNKPVLAAPKRHSAPALAAYHVAAAEFPVQRVASTLAGALRGRGFHAFVRPELAGNHKPSYRVETGDFARPADANTQVRLLKQDGYPAFVFQTH